MQLKHLFKNISEQDEPTQRTMVAAYRARRDADFTRSQAEYELKQTRKRTKRAPAIALTAEEKLLIKKLGITQAQLRAMKAMQNGEENGS